MLEPTVLDVAHRHRLTQRRERIAGRDELVRHEPREAGVGDGRCHRTPVQLLRAVQLVTPRNAPGVEMGDPILVVTDGADDVAFHDLHVIDVVQQLDAWRAHGLDHGDPEGSPVALVVGVIHLAVQELEADGDALRFRLRLDLVEPRHTVVDRLRVALAATVAEHRDHIRDVVARGEGKRLLQLPQQHPVVRPIVEARRNEVVARGGIAHGAHQTRLAHGVPILGAQQVDGCEPHPGRRTGERRQRDFAIGPAGNGLLEPSHAEAWARRYTALQGRAEGSGSQRRHRRSPVHQNSSRFRYSQLARMDANGPAESFTWTIGKRPGQRTKYASGSCPPLVIQYRSTSSWTSLGSVSASSTSYGNFPSSGANSKSWLW